MDVYQKVLVRLYEVTGGKDTVDIDFVEELKKEGFYPSRESILEHMTGEGWIAETARNRYIVRLTHWGSAEAKRINKGGDPNKASEAARTAEKFVKAAKRLSIAAEEFKAKPDAGKLKQLRAELKDVTDLSGELEEH